jgi:hypothetical protein
MIERRRSSDADLESIFSAALGAASKKTTAPEVHARFYPYAGLSSTIRLREGRVFVRVSDILEGSPSEVLYALACILVCKLYRRKTPQEHTRVYREYTQQPSVIDSSDAARRKRGFKVFTSPVGKAYDLSELFEDLNERYFARALDRPMLSWSQGITRRVLGHHDHVHGAIVVSRTLDSPKVPRFVVEYVMYHEMLHIKHPPKLAGNRTIYHGREFKSDELAFERYEEATQWLSKIASRVRPRRRRTRRRAPG